MTILCYHEVDPAWTSPLAVAPAEFEAQAAWLARRGRVVGLDAVEDRLGGGRVLPRGRVAITFDDGFAGVHTHALPVLRRLDLPATVFVVTATLAEPRREVDWVLGSVDRPLRPLTTEQILEMRAAGLRFGSHSHAHRVLTELGEKEMEQDLRRSREVLEDLLGEPARWVAYPRGRHDARVRRAAIRAGFTHGFALPESPERPDRMAIPRVGVYRGNGIRALRLKLAPWYLPVRTSAAYRLSLRARGRRIGPPPA